MDILDHDRWESHRAKTFLHPPEINISTISGARNYVNQRGFVFLWPIKGVDLPSLWEAMGGSYPVSSDHTDPYHITWTWKDDSLDKHCWYYAKILRRKATFISLEVSPYFYALSENYGSPEEDYLVTYEQGRMSKAAKEIYETLLDKGSLDTILLRKESHLTNAKESVFTRALEDLQADFKILPVGIADAGAWHYSYRYDLTSRHFPDLPEKARSIGEAEARQKLVEIYLQSVGAICLKDITRIFQWNPEVVLRVVERLQRMGKLVTCSRQDIPGEWLALPELVNTSNGT